MHTLLAKHGNMIFLHYHYANYNALFMTDKVDCTQMILGHVIISDRKVPQNSHR